MEVVRTMPYLSMVEAPKGLLQRFAWRYSRKQFGGVADPVRMTAKHSGLLVSNGALEMLVAKRWTALDPHLRWLAVQATAGAIGCSWCTDFGFYEGMQAGIDPRKVRDVPRWQDSDVYDEKERAVLAFADAVNSQPAAATQEHIDELRQFLSDVEVTELAGWIALENYRSRFNAGLGLISQGFSEKCGVPAVA